MDEAAIAKRDEERAKQNNLNNLQGELNVNLDDGIAGIARDTFQESPFNPDDFVLVYNIFDGKEHAGYQFPALKYGFTYAGQPYSVKPGQQFRLNGATAYVFTKHMVSLIYRRVLDDPLNDRRAYDLDDPFMKIIVKQVEATLRSEDERTAEIVEIPEYVSNDENLSKTIGSGEFETAAQYDDQEIDDESFEKIPDFAPGLNPRIPFDEEGKAIIDEPEKETKAPAKRAKADKPAAEFPDAQK